MIGVGVGIPFNRTSFGGAPSFTNTKSLLFDGVDEYVDCGSPTIVDGATNLSFSCWVKFNANALYAPFGYRGASGLAADIIHPLWQHTAGRLDFKIGGGTVIGANGGLNSTGVWYHIVCVYDGTQGVNSDRADLYINGVSTKASVTGTIGTSLGTFSGGASDRVFNIGKYNGITYEVNGYIDEVSIFDYTLTSGQVTSIYNSGVPTDLNNTSGVTAPVHWWRCGDGDTFPTINDVGTTGGNNGTMTNQEVGDIVTVTP